MWRALAIGARMPLVSITRLRVRAWRYLPAFVVGTFRSALQAKASSGSRAVSILSDSNFTFWTRTVWNDEAALRSFMLSGAHKKVMPRLLECCDEAAVVHWLQESQHSKRRGITFLCAPESMKERK